MANLSNINNKFIVEDSGDVGIGVTTATTKLHIGGTAPGDSIIRQDSTVSGTNWEIGERAAGKWQIFEDDGDTIVTTFMSTGNVGIGTDSPNQKITIGFADNGTDGISFRSTTYASLGKILCENDNSSTNGNLQFHTRSGGDVEERLRIDSSGVVNIGTATGTQPSYFHSYLNVQNNASTSDNASITITSGSSGYAGLHFGDSDNGRIGQVAYNNSNNSLLFTANNSTRMTIDSDGNVGIGTTSPNAKLKIEGDSATNGLSIKSAGNGGTYPLMVTWSGGAEGSAFCINDNLDVGIGTTSPTARLNVKASGSTVDQIAVTHSGNTVEIAQLGQSANGNSAGALLLKTNGGTDKVYLDAAGDSYFNGGNVGIGYTSPTYKLQLISTKTVATNIGMYSSAQGASTSNYSFYADANGATNNWAFYAASGNSYFASGIRLGGNGSSNELNYYEEGNWAPIIAHNDGTGAVPLTVSHARYLRVGQLVYISAYLTGINPNGNAGGSGLYYGVRNFPFQPENYGAWQIVYASSGITAYGGYSSGASLYFMANGTNGQRSTSHVNGAGVNAWGSNLTFMFNCVYNIQG